MHAERENVILPRLPAIEAISLSLSESLSKLNWFYYVTDSAVSQSEVSHFHVMNKSQNQPHLTAHLLHHTRTV